MSVKEIVVASDLDGRCSMRRYYLDYLFILGGLEVVKGNGEEVHGTVQ